MKQVFSIFFVLTYFYACRDKDIYDITGDKEYQKGKLTLEEKEKKNPTAFLFASGKKRKNFIRQTVVLGQVFNNAKTVTYKDMDVLLSFYSSTGALLEEDHQVVYETVVPGGTVSFKSKYFTPKGTDSVSMKVVAAKF